MSRPTTSRMSAMRSCRYSSWIWLKSLPYSSSSSCKAVWASTWRVRMAVLTRPGTGPTAAYAGVTLNGTEYVLQPLNPVDNLNTWVYWVLTRQGSTLTLYRDGVQIGQRTDLPATATANITGYIADQNNGLYYLNGGIDDVAVYASALTPSTIASHYQAAGYNPAP